MLRPCPPLTLELLRQSADPEGRCTNPAAIIEVAALFDLQQASATDIVDGLTLASSRVEAPLASAATFTAVQAVAPAAILVHRPHGRVTGLLATPPLDAAALAQLRAGALDTRNPAPGQLLNLWDSPAGALQLDDLLPILSRVVRAKKLREAGKVRSYLRAAYSAAIRARQNARPSDDLRALGISTNPARDLATIEGGNDARARALSLAELRAYWQRIRAIPSPRGALLRLPPNDGRPAHSPTEATGDFTP